MGVLIGGMVVYYIARQPQLDSKGLAGAVSTLAGAGVIGVFQMLRGKGSPVDPQMWLYPVGLLFGAIIMMLLLGLHPFGLLNRESKGGKPLVHPVVVIPGILGSKLMGSDGEVLWGDRRSLSNLGRLRARKLALCRDLLGMTLAGPAADPPVDYHDRLKALTGQSLREHPHCRTGIMVVIDCIARPKVCQIVPDTS